MSASLATDLEIAYMNPNSPSSSSSSTCYSPPMGQNKINHDLVRMRNYIAAALNVNPLPIDPYYVHHRPKPKIGGILREARLEKELVFAAAETLSQRLKIAH